MIVVGGGINGLTAAAYLAKAGLSVAVFEARGQCGAHCDTVELGFPVSCTAPTRRGWCPR